MNHILQTRKTKAQERGDAGQCEVRDYKCTVFCVEELVLSIESENLRIIKSRNPELTGASIIHTPPRAPHHG